MQSLTVATFNLGLLRLAAFGKTVFEFAPYVSQRLAAAPTALRTLEADIILLQEIYGAKECEWLAARLHGPYPHFAYRRRRRYFGLGVGLMVLSRYPLAQHETREFGCNLPDERLLAPKGYQYFEVNVPALGWIPMFNVHLTAGGVFHDPESERANSTRTGQVAELLRAARTASRVRILAGDFNAGPTVSRKNYDEIVNAGYVDCYQIFGDDRKDAITWDITNPLNTNGPHRKSPSQRIDHVFVTNDVGIGASAGATTILLQEPLVEVPDGRCVTVSDHYAVRATLTLG